MDGWYYLHENGDLIYKRGGMDTEADIMDSAFAKAMWPVDITNRANAWRLLVEALAAGANPDRVRQLANKWGCDDVDAKVYASRIGCLLGVDGDAKTATGLRFINLAESPAGFGKTYLEAMANLAKNLGYRPGKTFHVGFEDLLKRGGAR